MIKDDLAATISNGKFSELEISVRILWFAHRIESQEAVAFDYLVKFFHDHAISHPNRSRLQAKLRTDRRILARGRSDMFRLRASALAELDEEMAAYVALSRPTSAFVAHLESLAMNVGGEQTRSFVNETVACARDGTPRAAIIMAWCGAVSILQEHVFATALDTFNDDAVKNGLLKTAAKTLADLRDISKESQFLESLARISVIDDATKRTLKRCLDKRNDAGHPSEVRFSDAAVADQLESLILNVFSRFGELHLRRAA